TVVDQPHADNVLRASEGLLGADWIAILQSKGRVRRRTAIPNLRSVLFDRTLQVSYRWQWIIADFDFLEGVCRLSQRFGEHNSNAVANTADAIGNEYRPQGLKRLRLIIAARHEQWGHSTESIGKN